MTSLADFLEFYTPPRTTVRVLFDGDLAAQAERLEQAMLGALDAQDEDRAQELAREVRDIERRAGEAREFTFEAMPAKQWRQMEAEHPPPENLPVRLARQAAWDPNTFPVATIAASLVDPDLTVEEVAELEERLSLGQWLRLWGACLDVNVGDRDPSEIAARVLNRSRHG